MSGYCNLFPAGYVASQGNYRVCAMQSLDYGDKYSDPKLNMAMVEQGQVDHASIDRYLTDDHPAFTYLLGDQNHGCLSNQPTTLALFFLNPEERDAFMAHFEIT